MSLDMVLVRNIIVKQYYIYNPLTQDFDRELRNELYYPLSHMSTYVSSTYSLDSL